MVENYLKKVSAVLFTLTAVFVCSSVPNKAQVADNDLQSVKYWLEAGEKELTAEKFDDAVYSFTRCLVIKNDHAACLVNRGKAYSKLKKYLEAFDDLDKAVQIAPEMPEAFLERGKIAIGSDEKIKYFTKAVELKPDYAEGYYGLGLYYFLTDSKKSYTNYSKAIELDPTNFEAFISRGNIHQLNNKMELAIADYSRAIRINPDGRTYYIRALTYFDFRKYSKAIADFNRSAESDPNYYWTIKKRGEAYRKLGKLNLARADEQTAVKIGRPQ